MLQPGDHGPTCSRSATARLARNDSLSTDRATPCMEVAMTSACWPLICWVVMESVSPAAGGDAGQGRMADRAEARPADRVPMRLIASQRGRSRGGLHVR